MTVGFTNFHALSDSDVVKTRSTRGAVTLGAIGVTEDGRWYRWAKNGSSALAAGKLVQTEVPGANFDDLVIDGAHAIGEKIITVTNQNTTVTQNMFVDGYMNFEINTGVGQLYRIVANDAATGTNTFTVTLACGLAVAIGATLTVSLTKNPCDSVIIHPSPPTASLVGVPNMAVAASQYFWAQYRGMASILTDGTIVIGRMCFASDSVDGAVEDAILAEGTPNTLFNYQMVGVVQEVVATTGYSLINLMLP